MNLKKLESQGQQTIYQGANINNQGISVGQSSQAHAKQESSIFNSSCYTSLLTRDADIKKVLDIIKQDAIEKIVANYNTHRSIEINDTKDIEYLNEH